jgi:hypothetical protein
MTNGDLSTAVPSPIRMAGSVVLPQSVYGKAWPLAITAEGCHGVFPTLVPRSPSMSPTVSKSLCQLAPSCARSIRPIGGRDQIVELQPEHSAPERVNPSHSDVGTNRLERWVGPYIMVVKGGWSLMAAIIEMGSDEPSPI